MGRRGNSKVTAPPNSFGRVLGATAGRTLPSPRFGAPRGGVPETWWPAPLRTCLSPFLTKEEKNNRLASGPESIDWNAVAHVLATQHLLPLLSWELERLERLRLPETLRARARKEYDLNGVRWRFQRDAFRTVLDAAASAEFPLLVLRGPHVVESAYGGDYGLRPFRDIDAAVLPPHVRLFVEAVRQGVSHIALRVHDRPRAERKARLGSRMELVVQGIPLDLHWDLSLLYNFHRPRGKAALQYGIWERAERVRLDGRPYRVMGKEDLVLHLAEHAVIQHDLRGLALRNLIDFARAFARLSDQLDFDLLLGIATERASVSALSGACFAVKELVEVPERETGLHGLARRASRTVRRTVHAEIARFGLAASSEARRSPEATWRLRKTLQQLQPIRTTAAFMDGVGARLAFLREYVVPRPQVLSYAMGVWVSWPRYLAYLLGHPLVQILLAPAMAVLIRRQIEDLLRERQHQRSRLRRHTAHLDALLSEADLCAALDLLETS